MAVLPVLILEYLAAQSTLQFLGSGACLFVLDAVVLAGEGLGAHRTGPHGLTLYLR